MLPHFALLFGVSLLAWLAQSRQLSRSFAPLLWGLIFVAMALFGGLRGDFVGADTIAYVNRFNVLKSQDVIWDTFGSGEIGVKLLYAISLLIGNTPTTFLILSSGLASFLFLVGITRNAKVPALALFVFIAFGFYAFHLNGLRQGLALGFYMIAVRYLLTGNFVRYAAWVAVAALFHTTALFTLPMYAIFRLGFTYRTIAIFLLLAGLFAAFPDVVIELAGFANERYANYGNRTETGGVLLMAFHVLLSAVFIAGRRFVIPQWQRDYDILLLMLVFGSMIYAVVTFSGSYVEINRIAIYFTISMAFLWPIIIKSINKVLESYVIIFTIICFGFIFYFIYLSNIGNYIPYVIRDV